MKLLNFELSSPSFSIELIGLNFVWDLHNSGTFLGMNLDPNSNVAILSWRVTGHPAVKYSGCNLVFKGLKLMVVSARDQELPFSEDLCISGVSKIVPDQTREPQYRTKREWHEGDPFHLLFEFQSRRSVEIDAEAVELVGVSKSAESLRRTDRTIL